MTYIPRVILYNHREPNSHEPVVRDIFADELWDEAAYPPGIRVGLERVELNKETFIDSDTLPGRKVTRPRAIMLAYKPEFEDTPSTSWTHKPLPEEQAALDLVLAHYKEEEARILKFNDANTPNSEHNEQLTAVQDLIEKFSVYGAGFMETGNDLLHSEARGLSWANAAPNVKGEWSLTAYSLPEDRGVSYRLRRDKPLPEQGQFDYTVQLGNGFTQYEIVYGREKVEFIHYRNMKPAARTTLLKQLTDLLDLGRKTAADNTQLKAWKDELEEIEKAQRKAGVKKKAYPPTVRAQIEAIEQQITDLKRAKSGLPSGYTTLREQLEKQLYLDRKPIILQEQTQELIGKVFDTTITFDRRGFVAIRIGTNDPFIYENKQVIATRTYKTMLPRGSKLKVLSDGGSWDLPVGRPNYERQGILRTRPFQLSFAPNPDEVSWSVDCDSIVTSINGYSTTFATIQAGCFVTLSLLPYTPTTGLSSGVVKPGFYQIEMILESSDGQYTPMVHRAELEIAAGASPAVGAKVWDSADHPNSIADIHLRDDLERAMAADVFLNNPSDLLNPEGAAKLPVNLAGRVCDIIFIDSETLQEYTSVHHGMVKKPSIKTQTDTDNDFTPTPSGISTVSFSVVGPEAWLNGQITATPTGNGKLPNEYVRQLLGNTWIDPSEYASIPTGVVAGLARIPQASPGKSADVRPESRAKPIEFIRWFVKTHCPGWIFWSGDSGFRLTKEVERDRPDLAYDPALSGEKSLTVHWGLEFVQNTDDYYTSCTFTGIKNPKTGVRVSRSMLIQEAVNPAFRLVSKLYVGEPIHYNAPVDESLKTDMDCYQACREFMRKKGRPPWYANPQVPFRPDVRAGDIVRLKGIRCLVQRVDFGSINAGSGQRMTLPLRLYQDPYSGLPL